MIKNLLVLSTVWIVPGLNAIKTKTEIIRCATLVLLMLVSTQIIFGQNFSARKDVRTKYGPVSGKQVSAAGVYAFKGIPFAAPPVGNLRWREPMPPAPWTEIKMADQFGPSPMQAKPTPFMVYTREFLIPENPISEDCLYLNIWTSAKTSTEKKPVFVWIYGGGFTSGGSACDIYDGTAMAEKGVVFVSFNYRVGIFGFFAHPELTKESPHRASGNYGIMDQIAALKWVAENISAFGGDPSNVTIAGQSAGSFSVCTLVASPLAKGLFHRAIAESGSSVIADPKVKPTDLVMAEAEGKKITDGLNVFTLADMRNTSAETLMKARIAGIRPIADGYVLPAPVAELFKKGNVADVPLLTGWNADEGLVFAYKSRDAYVTEATAKYGTDVIEYLKYFPAETEEQAMASQVAISRDMIFALPNYKWASFQSARKNPAYVYHFSRKPPASPDYVKYGAFHTAEVPYALGNLKYFNRDLQDIDRKISADMLSYWVNFAKIGNPNGEGLPKWPVFTPSGTEVMIFSDKSAAGKMPGKAGLDFLYSFMMK
ncbi:carboxylesterase/lipase family protein [Pollutibacter soli]|uniref:carboxylesterase/lipase family protein n=1 Tax=Pollutibacter soli TaxID=3034157 RepID=UPI0030138315